MLPMPTGAECCRAANQFWYGVYGCKSGWFCCSKPVRNRVKVFVDDGAGGWKEVPVPRATKAVVVCNLQSYAGGSNLWGKHTAADEKKGWKEPGVADGLVEVCVHGVMCSWSLLDLSVLDLP